MPTKTKIKPKIKNKKKLLDTAIPSASALLIVPTHLNNK
jgi:hypothetical protein